MMQAWNAIRITWITSLVLTTLSACSGAGDANIGGNALNDASTDSATQDSATGQSDSSPGNSVSDGGSDADAEAGSAHANRCPSSHGPSMVEIFAPSGGSFCVDSTEVTTAQLKEFFVATGGQFAPDKGAPCNAQNDMPLGPPARPDCDNDPVAKATDPAHCIDWCLASAYCRWAGKRLCGKIGGGALPLDAANDPKQAQWYSACSEGGMHKFPYGDQFDFARCNYWGTSTPAPAPVGSFSQCHAPDTPFAQIFDMSGNVVEWEDSCSADHMQCAVRGGSYNSDYGHLEDVSCSNAGSQTKTVPIGTDSVTSIGIRCCAD